MHYDKHRLAKSYSWEYLYNSFSLRQIKFLEIERKDHAGWVSASCWSSPIVALAPPFKYHPRESDPSLGLNINTREHYPPRWIVSRSSISKGNGNGEGKRYTGYH